MTERVFRVGQKVRIVRSPSLDRIGMVVTIARGLAPAKIWPPSPWCGHIPNGTPVYAVDLPSRVPGCSGAVYPAAYLEPIDDGREPAEWTAELLKVIEGGNARLALRKERA